MKGTYSYEWGQDAHGNLLGLMGQLS